MISHYSRNLRFQLDSALTHQAVSGIVPGVALSLSVLGPRCALSVRVKIQKSSALEAWHIWH